MTYSEWLKEGEDVLRALPQPTPEEDAALSLELDRENAEGAEEEAEMGKQMLDDETGEPVAVAPEDMHPLGLVVGEFVEIGAGQWVRADRVRRVSELHPKFPGGNVTELDMAPGEEPGTAYGSKYPARTVLAALNMALENGQQRRVERVEY